MHFGGIPKWSSPKEDSEIPPYLRIHSSDRNSWNSNLVNEQGWTGYEGWLGFYWQVGQVKHIITLTQPNISELELFFAYFSLILASFALRFWGKVILLHLDYSEQNLEAFNCLII